MDEIPPEIKTIPKMLVDDTRFAIILTLLKNGEMSFSDLKKTLEIPRNRLSHHLTILTQNAYVNNYYKKIEESPDYSFYDTTHFCRDIMKGLFTLIEPRTSAEEQLTTIYQRTINYNMVYSAVQAALADWTRQKLVIMSRKAEYEEASNSLSNIYGIKNKRLEVWK